VTCQLEVDISNAIIYVRVALETVEAYEGVDDDTEDGVLEALNEAQGSLDEALLQLNWAQDSARTVRRVLDATPPVDLGMSTPEGNRFLLAELETLEQSCKDGNQLRGTLESSVTRMLNRVELAGYDGAYSHGVRTHVYAWVDALCDALEWKRLYE
jgi:hypothetical protein